MFDTRHELPASIRTQRPELPGLEGRLHVQP
jgi:hypothetical protein